MLIKQSAKAMTLLVALAGIALIPLSTHVAQASASSINANPTTLNLIVEGAFVCILDGQQVRIVAPRVEHHIYRIAGEDIQPGTYSLHGVAGLENVSKIDWGLPAGATNFQFTASNADVTSREKNAYFSLILPAPKQIIALHTRRAEIVDKFGKRRTVTMPTSYAFVYDVSDAGHLGLMPSTEWKPQTSLGKSEYANLVVVTGTRDTSPGHIQAVWSQLMSYVPGSTIQLIDVGANERVAELRGYPGPVARASTENCTVGPIVLRVN
jgi:hypothetical protein